MRLVAAVRGGWAPGFDKSVGTAENTLICCYLRDCSVFKF
jgi:hypothetical protein